VEEVLEACGVGPRTLAQGERAALDEQGYVVLAGCVGARELGAMRVAFDAAAGAASAEAGTARERGTRHVEVLAHAAFDPLLAHARVLAAVHHVLGGAFRLAQVSGREPLSGFGRQGLHADWPPRPPGDAYRVATVLWMLDDFTADNGATRVVPGTHRLPGGVPKGFADPARRHPEERSALGSAGDALVLNGHLWHSGTENRSQRRRRSVQAVFVGRAERSHHGPPLRPAPRHGAEVRWVLGG